MVTRMTPASLVIVRSHRRQRERARAQRLGRVCPHRRRSEANYVYLRYLETGYKRAVQPSKTRGRYSEPGRAKQALTTHRRPFSIATERACLAATGWDARGASEPGNAPGCVHIEATSVPRQPGHSHGHPGNCGRDVSWWMAARRTAWIGCGCRGTEPARSESR